MARQDDSRSIYVFLNCVLYLALQYPFSTAALFIYSPMRLRMRSLMFARRTLGQAGAGAGAPPKTELSSDNENISHASLNMSHIPRASHVRKRQ